MTKINMYEKANIISFERELVTDSVAKSMGVNLYAMINAIKEIETDDITNKKVVKAMNMLTNLTIDLVKSNNLESILKTRNRINYYINRIKTLTNITNNKFYDSLFLYRDDIKEYIRIIKRRNNINEITKTYYETITKNEKKEINALMAKERKFNKRLKEKYTKERIIKRNNISEKTSEECNGVLKFDEINEKTKIEFQVADGIINYDDISLTESIPAPEIIDGDVEFEKINETKSENDVIVIGNLQFEEIQEDTPITGLSVIEGDFNYDENLAPEIINRDFERIELYAKLGALVKNYKLVKTNKYDSNKIFSNIKNLIINIPRYLKNKKTIKQMERDYNVFYHGRDLFRLIRYSKYDNTFKYAIGEIFKSKNLEVERAKKYRMFMESIYDNMPIDEEIKKDFKYRTLRKMSA